MGFVERRGIGGALAWMNILVTTNEVLQGIACYQFNEVLRAYSRGSRSCNHAGESGTTTKASQILFDSEIRADRDALPMEHISCKPTLSILYRAPLMACVS